MYLVSNRTEFAPGDFWLQVQLSVLHTSLNSQEKCQAVRDVQHYQPLRSHSNNNPGHSVLWPFSDQVELHPPENELNYF